MSQNAAGAGVGTGDVIQFGTPTYNWSTRAIGAGAGSFGTLVRSNARFTPTKPGLLVLALTYVARSDSRAAPYTFEIRLKPALDVPATNIPKAQSDIIMNVLDAYHPIGGRGTHRPYPQARARDRAGSDEGVSGIQLSDFPRLTKPEMTDTQVKLRRMPNDGKRHLQAQFPTSRLD